MVNFFKDFFFLGECEQCTATATKHSFLFYEKEKRQLTEVFTNISRNNVFTHGYTECFMEIRI